MIKQKFSDIFDDVTKNGKKIPANQYQEYGKYQIIDQGQNATAGYTDCVDGLFTDIPAIVFGDHTRVIKYIDKPCFLGADGVKLLKTKDRFANYKYLYYALLNVKIPDTGYNRHFKWLKESCIPMYDISVQNDIVNHFDKIFYLINARKEQLLKLDELVKSRFVEMFGDQKSNQYGLPIAILGDVCTFYSGTGFPNGYQGHISGKYPFYKVRDISRNVQNGNKFLKDCDNYIDRDVVDKLKGSVLPKGTVVFAKIGEALRLNRRAITSQDCLIDNNAMGIRPGNNLDLEYFYSYMLQLDMGKYAGTTAIPSVRKSTLENVPIIVPDLPKQKQFADFAEHVDKSKFEIKQSLEKLELLKRALMQKYFG